MTFVLALIKRDLWKYFTNPTGYVFITFFIFISAAAAFWKDRFFLNNLASLEQLNLAFPYFLLFFIPTLTMAVWAEERKQGTDELLLTLPATSLEVVLGKYVATLGIYTVSLFLSLSHVIVLFWLGSPDLGLMFSNYVGYWLAGGALIAVGMVASLLTSNVTIAFVIGATFCSFFVLTESMGAFSEDLGRLLTPLSVFPYFGDFARGVMSFSGVLYFVSIAGVMLYINVLLVERRHWPRESDGYRTWVHYVARAVAVITAIISVNVILDQGVRLDVTAERLHSLSSETQRLISEISEERPVFIQAYVSPEVPKQYVQTRANLLGILEEVDSLGGPKVQVLIEDTEPFSQAARDAREKFGIVPQQVPNLGSARAGFSDVFLGVAFTCGAEEQIILFLEQGLPIEYEIIRSLRVVARTERRKVGLLSTGAKLFGGFDFQSMQSSPPWSVVEELKKQYEVVQISANTPIVEEMEGLVVALPSSLAQEEMNHLLAYIEAGNATLLLVDPLPIINIGLAPSEKSGANMNPFTRSQGPPPKAKGNIHKLMSRIGVSWDSGSIIWDSYNPHPELAHLPPEVVFIGKGNENAAAFNEEHQVSADLQEVVLLYPGQIEKAANSDFDFESLLKSGLASGRFNYHQLVQRNFLGAQLRRNLPHRPDTKENIVAAHIRSAQQIPPTSSDQEDEENVGDSSSARERSDTSPLNVIVIADLDFISEQFFRIRAQGLANFKFDNVTFFLNCIDILLGDESFVALRNKRVRHRTLERVEKQTRNFVEQRVAEETSAEAEAEKALSEAQSRLDERVDEVRQRPDLDVRTKQIMARNLQEAENRRFEVLKTNIEAEKQTKINRSKEEMEEQIRRIQSNIKTLAVLLPPVPVFLVGVLIFVRRQRREREGAVAAQRLRA